MHMWAALLWNCFDDIVTKCRNSISDTGRLIDPKWCVFCFFLLKKMWSLNLVWHKEFLEHTCRLLAPWPPCKRRGAPSPIQAFLVCKMVDPATAICKGGAL